MPYEPNIDSYRKEDILGKSPLLRAFLDRSATLDPPTWGYVLYDEYEKVDREIKHTLGENYDFVGLTPLYAMTTMLDVFEPTMPHQFQEISVKVIAGIGFEIGNEPDANLFLDDIVKLLTSVGALNKDPKKAQNIPGCLLAILQTGVLWRKGSPDDRLSVFRDFVDGLDKDN